MVSQRDSDANADFDCVPASIAACMEYLTGKHYTAAEIKDAAYGAAYTGGTDAHEFVDYCAAQGVRLAPIDGSAAQLVGSIKSFIASGHPCIITEPDPYLAGWLHVCAAYECDSASITVMDPWIDQPVKKSDGQWVSQLVGNEVWMLERFGGGGVTVTVQTSGVPDGWHDDGTKLTAPNGVQVVLGFRNHVLTGRWYAANVPLEAEYHADPVLLHNASVGAGQRQIFRDCMLWWTQTKGVIQEPYIGLELDAAYKK